MNTLTRLFYNTMFAIGFGVSLTVVCVVALMLLIPYLWA